MSEKKAKQDRNLKLMTEEAGLNETAKKQAQDISKMYEDRDKKALGAREHLVSQLKITVDKYRTANGVMSALDTVRLVHGEDRLTLTEQLEEAAAAARHMSHVADMMAKKAGELDPEMMDKLCDGVYDKDFAGGQVSARQMVLELMTLQLCQNVGPNAEDVAEFCRTADDEIEKARENLKTFCAENDIDFNELCGPHEDCPTCLCASCANDCKEDRQIKDGQKVDEVCDKYMAPSFE